MAVDIKEKYPTFDHHHLQKICQQKQTPDAHDGDNDNLRYHCQPLMIMSPGGGGGGGGDHREEAVLLMRNNIAGGASTDPDRDPGSSSRSRGEESGRVKLLRHWNDVGGRVCIPEKWGQEALLKDWMDSSLFDALLAPQRVVSAREALVAERKRETTTTQPINMERLF